MRESLYRFKYAGRREYAGFYADRAAAHYADWLVRHQVEAILPVPMYRPKQRLRGYNQAEEFARALGRKTGIPVDTKMVRRIRNTVPLKNLNPTERQRNLKSAFQFGTDIVKYNQIVLTDDIYTTGSTVDEIARVLRAAGVREIYYICVSIGSGY